MTVSGGDVLLKGLDQLIAQAPQALAAALYQEAEAIMADSKANYVPVDTGVLRDSGFVAEPEIDANVVSVELGYGGAASAYALVQHERLDFHHTVGGPKYLERPFLDAVSGLEERLAERLEPLLGGAV